MIKTTRDALTCDGAAPNPPIDGMNLMLLFLGGNWKGNNIISGTVSSTCSHNDEE